ncbi:Transcriptional regulator, LysR family [Candidatus Phaeomarinobacter ectocarpi]|uniref:Transcriptional regulator, LysR family n=1 Tax=Candidatus Phaeomarinibacter ectocarpi TaxID=1458461 RepID=X5MMS8_9HYPH|nr:LysR family transcriptional regulator [Candidatus Phaeomarinobacter ectocarpi]CDO60665.1 Transcriptional regulator, LysR family [Candidatus Phaeomarinobacter ectocarpi]
MNFRDLDLNLLMVFNAVYQERSTSLAAKRLGISQPAVSNALKRLRTFTGDTLFYKSGSGVAPTRTAVTLAIPIGHALDTVENSLRAVRSFDPATSTRTFTIAVTDIIKRSLLPALVTLARQMAPNIVLEFVPHPAGRTTEALVGGEVDIAGIASFQITPELVTKHIWRERMGVILSKDHPLAELGSLSIEQLNQLTYIKSAQIPLVFEHIENIFQSHGVNRHFACQTADTESMYELVAISDLVMIAGLNFARQHNVDGRIATLEIPFELPGVDFNLGWTQASEADEGHRWLREHMISILQSAGRVMKFEMPRAA